MDKIEDFIKRNKEGLDYPRDSQAGWKELEARMDATSRSTSTLNYWKVAAVVFLMSTIALSVMRFNPAEGSQIADNSSELAIEDFYVQQISLKLEEYTLLADDNQREELMRDLERMDVAYNELKESFDEMNSEEFADAMVENLRLRIVILNEQIQILRNGKDTETAYHSS